jgi:rhodanese-related sulfurtransferase
MTEDFFYFYPKNFIMKYLRLIPICIFFIFFACKNESSPNQQKSTTDGVVDVEEFALLLKTDNQLIDVRTPEELSIGYIPNAVNIDFRGKDFEKKLMDLDKSKPVLLYCKSGARSGSTYTLLKEKGFQNVYDLKEGFTAWANANKPISK